MISRRPFTTAARPYGTGENAKKHLSASRWSASSWKARYEGTHAALKAPGAEVQRDLDELLRPCDGQHLQQHLAHDTEQRGVDPNREPRREDGHQREGRRAAVAPQRKPDVAARIVQPPPLPDRADLFRDLTASSEFQPGAPRRFRAREAARHVRRDLLVDVELELLVDLTIAQTESVHQLVEDRHDHSPVRRISVIACDSRSQLSRSMSSCFRPAFVRL